MSRRFVVVGHDGLRSTSADGTSWSTPTAGKEGETFRAVAVGGGRCVAGGVFGGRNLFAASNDGGATWKPSGNDAKYAHYVRGVAWTGEGFLAVGGDATSVGASHPFAMTSRDGVAWSEPRQIGGKHILRRVAAGAGLLVGVGDRGRRAVSKDGRSWTDAAGVKAIDTLVDVAFGDGVFVGVGLHGLRATTRDGLAWSAPQRGEEGEHLNSVLWTGDRFVAIGQGATWSSRDGERWERTPNVDAPETATFGDGVFVGVAWRGRILRSTDGVRWQQTCKADRHIEAVGFGEFG